jgi:hypothetical protein
MQLVPSSWLEIDEILRRVLKIDGKTFLKGKGSTSIPEKGSGTPNVQQENRHLKEGCSKPRQR